MYLIPAIDLLEGKCVRLYQGDYNKSTVYYEDPLEAAEKWQNQGAKWIHIVDLDGARTGAPSNFHIVESIHKNTQMFIQVGGCIRSIETASKFFDSGINRVVLGTSAIQDPEFVANMIKDFGAESIVVGVDSRDNNVSINGWKETTSFKTIDFIRGMQELNVQRFIYTDISRDGTLTEPNFEAIKTVFSEVKANLIVSGGISSLEHIARLVDIGVEGAILGSALYKGIIKFKQAKDLLNFDSVS